MNSRTELLERVQDDASDAWIKSGGIGTLIMGTGTGKTITAFKCLYKALEKGWLKPGDRIRFLAETDARKGTLIEEIDAFIKLYGKNPAKDFDIVFFCYQALDESESVMDIYDEVHDTLTKTYMMNIRNSKAKLKLGLTAFVDKNMPVFRDEYVPGLRQSEQQVQKGVIGNQILKGQLLTIVCPVVYEYGLEVAVKDNVLSSFETFIIDHELDEIKPYKAPFKSWNKLVSEKDYYEAKKRVVTNYQNPAFVKKTQGVEMARMLWNLPSKVNVAKALLARIKGKTILFGVNKEILRYITENVAEDDVTQMVEDFNNGKINVIASAKKLKQGITLQGVTNVIIISYYSTPSDLVQQLGRVVRYAPDKIAKVFIIRTLGTLEEKWAASMVKSKFIGDKAQPMDLKIAKVVSSKSILQWWNLIKDS